MNQSAEIMSIGELSKKSGVGIEAIRYYERLGLLKPLARKTSGYRIFNRDSYKTLRFLKQAQELGFSLSEIRDLLRLRANKESQCGKVKDKALIHIKNIEEKIEKLKNIRDVLSRLIQQCSKQEPNNNCPILDCFDSEE